MRSTGDARRRRAVAERLDGQADEASHLAIRGRAREPLRDLAQFRDAEWRSDAYPQLLALARVRQEGALRHRVVRALQVDGEDVDPGCEGEIGDRRLEFLQGAVRRARTLRKHEEVVPVFEGADRRLQRLLERSAALDGNEVGEVPEPGPLPGIVEEIVASGQPREPV